jgi:hypothetical protein
VILHLIQALLAALMAGVAPGYFWAKLLRPSADLAERLTYSVAISMTLVSATVLIPARLMGMGVTSLSAVSCVLLVFLTGLVAYLRFGPGKERAVPIERPPANLGGLSSALLAAALVLALTVFPVILVSSWILLPIFLFVFLAGVVWLVESRQVALPELLEDAPEAVRWPMARRFLLPAVLLLVLFRSYVGPVLYDWPYLRGGDQFNHAVMANMMLTKGSVESYLIYPPGLHAFDAVLSRLSGLEPVDLFPALAPALLLLPTLACYAVARRLWGWECGVASAVFGGLVLNSTYLNILEARYPNLVSAQFLLVLFIAALIGVYNSPSIRTGLLMALLGSSVVLYHPVASLYEAVLLVLVALIFLPYLLLRERKTGITLLLSLMLLGLLSVVYAWDTYNLPRLVLGLLDHSRTGVGGKAVKMAIGTQHPPGLKHLLVSITHPVLWLGIFGALLLIVGMKRADVPSTLAKITLFLWLILLFVGSRTALSGFPERFERDIGVPLALFAAFAVVSILRSVAESPPGFLRPARIVAATLMVLLVGLQVGQNFGDATTQTHKSVMTPQLAAAGEWLGKHNTGGNIVSPPYLDNITNRAILAMGDYTGLQSFTQNRIRLARAVPPSGDKPLWDAQWVLHHPENRNRTRQVLKEYDIRYIVLSKDYPGIRWRLFRNRPDLYQTVFDNKDVIILAPLKAAKQPL